MVEHMIRRTFAVSVALGTLAASLTLGAAEAQTATTNAFDRGRNESVTERHRPELDPIGVPVGALRLFPSLTVGLAHDDNVYAAETNEQSDTITTLAPAATLRSQWSRHYLEVGAAGERREYADLDNESTTTWRAFANGLVDIRRDLRGRLSLAHNTSFEPRGDNDPLGLVEPIELSDNHITANIEKEFNRVRVSFAVSRAEIDYKDGRLGGGGIVDQDFRDRDLTTWSARADYALTPGTAIFAAYTDRSYDYTTAGGNRDFDASQALAGLSFDLTNLVRGEIGLGYVSSDYAAGVGDTDGFSQYGRLEWFATRLTTVSLRASRDVTEAGVAAASSILREEYVVGVDHELLRNVVIGAEAGWVSDEYDGIDREDDRKVLSASVDWHVNRVAVVHAGLYREDQESTGAARIRDYDRTSASVGVTLRR